MRSSTGILSVDVVVELNAPVAGMGAQKASDVLDHSPPKGEGKGHEERVELRPVEPLAKVGAGRHEHDARALRPRCHRVGHGDSRLLAQLSAEHERVVAGRAEAGDDRLEVVGALREYGADAASRHGVVDIRASLLDAMLVLDQRAEHCLDRCGLVLARLRAGLVDDQLTLDRIGACDVPGADLESGRAALKRL